MNRSDLQKLLSLVSSAEGMVWQDAPVTKQRLNDAIALINAELAKPETLDVLGYQSMFHMAARDLAAIHDALGLDPADAAGAAPIIVAIQKLKAKKRTAEKSSIVAASLSYPEIPDNSKRAKKVVGQEWAARPCGCNPDCSVWLVNGIPGTTFKKSEALLVAQALPLYQIARAVVSICDGDHDASLACMEGSPLVDAARKAVSAVEGTP